MTHISSQNLNTHIQSNNTYERRLVTTWGWTGRRCRPCCLLSSALVVRQKHSHTQLSSARTGQRVRQLSASVSPSVDREWSAPQRPVSSSAAARGWWWQPKSLPNSLPWVCHRCGLCRSSLLSFKRYTQRYVKLCFFIEGIFTWQTEALSLYREHRRDTRTVGPSQCRGVAAKRTFIVVSFLHSFNCLFVVSEVGLLPSCGQNQHSTLRQWKGWPKLPQVVVDQPLHHDGFIQPQHSSAGSPSQQLRALQPSGSTRLFKIGNFHLNCYNILIVTDTQNWFDD